MVSVSEAVVVVSVEGVRVAIAAAVVREIVASLTPIPIPGATAGLIGVVPWRGRAVAVLDLGQLVGRSSGGARPRVVMVEHGGDALALPVEHVVEPTPIHARRPAHAARMPFAREEVALAEGEDHIPLLALDLLLHALEGAQP